MVLGNAISLERGTHPFEVAWRGIVGGPARGAAEGRETIQLANGVVK